VLQSATNELNIIAGAVMVRARAVGQGPDYCRALESLRALDNALFHKRRTWGSDPISLKDISDAIDAYSWPGCGYTSFSYILQVKVMQQDETCGHEHGKSMDSYKKQFAADVESLLRQGRLRVPDAFAQCQTFTPKILLQRYAFAKEVLRDPRPDYLGRSGIQALCDAGISHRWRAIRATPQTGQDHSGYADYLEPPATSFEFIAYLPSGRESSIERLSQLVNWCDRLGRTVLHHAVRQGGISNVLTLLDIGAERHYVCLNGFSLLHIAAAHGNTDMMRHLLEDRWYCHSLGETDELLRNPFWYAARRGHVDMMRLLAPDFDTILVDVKDFDPFQEDSHYHTVLSIAARQGRTDLLNYLLELRARRWRVNPTTPRILPTEHLLWVSAFKSTNSDCVTLVLKHRKWSWGDGVHKKAMVYAQVSKDQQLQTFLNGLCQVNFKLC
jgi:ankyrin repeat protein